MNTSRFVSCLGPLWFVCGAACNGSTAPTPPPADAGTPAEGGTDAATAVIPDGSPGTPPPGVPQPVEWNAVVGAGGVFGQSFDQTTWSVRTVTTRSLFAVTCQGNLRGWAAGEQGYVAHTEDGGATWTTQDPHVTVDLHAIRFGTPMLGVVAGDAGALAVSADGGAHWNAVLPLTSVALRGAAVAGDVGIIVVVGDGGAVLRSADAGGSWATVAVPGAGDLRAVASDTGAHTMVAVDALGAIWSSADRGLSFTRDTVASLPLDSVAMADDGSRALVVGRTGTALTRAAAGAWTPIATGVSADLHAALVSDSGRFYAAGDTGTLVTSTDLGAHWAQIPLGTTSVLYGLEDL